MNLIGFFLCKMWKFQVDFLIMKLLVCDECGLQLTPKALQYHQKNNHSRESFPCADCEKVFSASTRLQVHIHQAHSAHSQFYIVKMIETEDHGLAFEKCLNHFNSMNM